MTLFMDLEHGDKFKFKNKGIDDGGIRTKIIHHNLIYQPVLTEQEVTTETEEWVNTKKFRSLSIGDTFKWTNGGQEPHTKVTIVLSQNAQEHGYMTSDGKVYKMAKSAFSTTDKVWTLEKVTKTTKQWV